MCGVQRLSGDVGFLLIASLPELHWPDVGSDEYDAPEERAQGRREDRGGERLEEEHGRV